MKSIHVFSFFGPWSLNEDACHIATSSVNYVPKESLIDFQLKQSWVLWKSTTAALRKGPFSQARAFQYVFEVLSKRHIYSLAASFRGHCRILSSVGSPNIYYFVCNQNYCQHKISQHIHIWNGPQKMSMWNFHMNSEHPSSPHLNRQNFVHWFVWFVRRKGDQVAKYPDGQSCHHMCLKVVVPFWGRTSP